MKEKKEKPQVTWTGFLKLWAIGDDQKRAKEKAKLLKTYNNIQDDLNSKKGKEQ
ncbi:MAG: hypothetical protein HOG49_12790 [Candidatus Scalindua sp.]|jgi:hypothetical protein|nr:hypothetical protein [Candidatus Scalindua sp.]